MHRKECRGGQPAPTSGVILPHQVRNSSPGQFHKLLQSARCAVVIGVRAQQLCRGPIPALRPYGNTLRMPYKAGCACRQLWAERVDRLLREDPDGLPYEPASSKGRMPGPGISLRAAVGYHRYSPAACRLCSDVACKVMPRVLLNTAHVLPVHWLHLRAVCFTTLALRCHVLIFFYLGRRYLIN